MSHNVVLCDVDCNVSRRWGRQVVHDLIKHDALLWLVLFQQLWLVHFNPCCSIISEHAHNYIGHKPLWNEVKFIDCDPYYYTHRVKEAIHKRLHPNNIKRDSGIEIPEAWMPMIQKNINVRAVWQWTTEGANHWMNSKDRNAPIRAVEKQLITAEHHALWDHTWPVDLIAWRRLAVCSQNIAIYITHGYIVRQTENLGFIVIHHDE